MAKDLNGFLAELTELSKNIKSSLAGAVAAGVRTYGT